MCGAASRSLPRNDPRPSPHRAESIRRIAYGERIDRSIYDPECSNENPAAVSHGQRLGRLVADEHSEQRERNHPLRLGVGLHQPVSLDYGRRRISGKTAIADGQGCKRSRSDRYFEFCCGNCSFGNSFGLCIPGAFDHKFGRVTGCPTLSHSKRVSCYPRPQQ
ncbi:hypothetical protein [Salinibacter phage 5_13]